MATFDRTPSSGFARIDAFEHGFGWLAHPDEVGQRASHAFVCEEAVWIVDPLMAPGVVERISALGDVAGVAICSSWHARDAAVFARAFDVSVYVPADMRRVAARIDAPVERYRGELPATNVTTIHRRLVPGFEEAILVHEPSNTLYVPDSLGTARYFRTDAERIGVSPFSRVRPPFALLSVGPDRVLVGHGRGITDDATAAIRDAIEHARRRAPRLYARRFGDLVRTGWSAVRG